MINQHFRGDFLVSETFWAKSGTTEYQIPVPSHVRIDYLTKDRTGVITVERNGNTLKGCTLSADGMKLICSVPLSRTFLGAGRLLHCVTQFVDDNSFPGGIRQVVTPGEVTTPEGKHILLYPGPSDDSVTIQTGTVIFPSIEDIQEHLVVASNDEIDALFGQGGDVEPSGDADSDSDEL